MKIEYISEEEYESSYRSEIYCESESLIQNHLWWNEPFTLFDRIEFPLHLTGESNLIRDYLSDEFGPRRAIERKDDVFLALVDYIMVIDVLEQLSRGHEIVWRVYHTNISGKEINIGYIDSGDSDEGIMEFVTETLDRYKLDHESLFDKELQNLVYSKYFDEADNPIYLN